MVFPSVPLYPGWHQANQVQGGARSTRDDHNQQHSQFPPRPGGMQLAGSGSMGLGSRPGSMAERARMANLPQPEAALRCPRCESNNTKFCYYNNYSLNQPRHFCKTCRRYWTHGGARRNVPVGGGFRRNKRSKSRSSRSKSPAPARSAAAAAGCSAAPDNLSHLAPLPQLPFLPSSAMHQFGEFGASELGLCFGGTMMSGASDSEVGLLSGLAEQWKVQQQFPLLTGLDPPVSSGLFHSLDQGEPCVEPSFCEEASQLRARQGLQSGMTNPFGTAVKLGDHNHNHRGVGGLMMTSTASRNILGINMNHHQYGWSDDNASDAWPHDLSSPGFTGSFSSTSTSHLL